MPYKVFKVDGGYKVWKKDGEWEKICFKQMPD